MKKAFLTMMMASLLLVGCSGQSSSGGETAYVVEKKEYYTNGELTQVNEFVIGENGLPTQGVNKDSDGNQVSQIEYELNDKGRISKATYTSVYGDVSYTTYDDNGNYLTYKRTDSEMKNTFNEDNQIVKSQLYNEDNELISETVYTYDDNGKKASEEMNLLSSPQYKCENYTYDEHGNVTGYHYTDYLNGKEGDYQYENIYDDNGNLVEYSYNSEQLDENMQYVNVKYTVKCTYKAVTVKDANEKTYVEKFNGI